MTIQLAAEAPALPASGPERLDIVALLRSYREALVLAQRPPASLALPGPLAAVVRRLRPTWGCELFVTRSIRRRVDALERALTARVAVGEADADDLLELEALRRFRSSLAPPPSRWLTVAALIGAILASQAVVGLLIKLAPTDGHRQIGRALSELQLTPDVKSVGDIAGALAAANYYDNGMVLLALIAVFYAFARPLACGHRLAYWCLGRPERLGRRRRRSPLRVAAVALRIPEQELQAVRVARARIPREAPLDLLVKAAPWLLVAYIEAGSIRFDGEPHREPVSFVAWLLLCTAGLYAFSRLARRRPLRDRRPARIVVRLVAAGLAAYLFFTMVEQLDSSDTDNDWFWLVLAALGAARIAWLTRQARSRGTRAAWILVPLALVCFAAVIVRYDAAAIDRTWNAKLTREYRREALAAIGAQAVPAIGRGELQMMLTTHADLSGGDLRGQDLHGLSLAGKELVHARLALADLRKADVTGAHLRGADLRGAIAAAAVLIGADLRSADLRCADLRDADLTGARLGNADVDGAIANAGTSWPEGFDPDAQAIQSPDVLVEPRIGIGDVYWYVAQMC